MRFTKNSIISATLFAILVATLMALEEFYQGEMSATTAVEEVIAHLFVLVILFVCVALPFQRIIGVLDDRMNWHDHFFKRLSIEGITVLILSIVLGIIFGNLIHHYIEHQLETGTVIIRTTLFLIITSSIIMALLELRRVNDHREELILIQEKLEKENIETLYNSLKQQVNPHFLFNSLSVLSSLVLYDPKKAEEFIENFADIYRYVLDINKHQLVSIKEELDFLDSYLFLQKIRFGDYITVNKQLSPQILASQIPPLSLQIVFENILKHNVISKTKPMSISLINSKDSLIITNPIHAKKNKEGTGLGLINLNEKYDLLGYDKPIINEDGRNFSITLPLINSIG